MIVATWVGGPRDGQRIGIKDPNHRIIKWTERVPLLAGPSEEGEDDSPPYCVYQAPVQLTPNGYRVFWAERVQVYP